LRTRKKRPSPVNPKPSSIAESGSGVEDGAELQVVPGVPPLKEPGVRLSSRENHAAPQLPPTLGAKPGLKFTVTLVRLLKFENVTPALS
jgi:hypothetical protein